MKTYKPTFSFLIKFVLFALFLILVISPIFGRKTIKGITIIAILLFTTLYFFLKKRVSKISIDENNNIIIIEVSHLLFLSKKSYNYKINSLEITEYEKPLARTSMTYVFKMEIDEDNFFEIESPQDGWTDKTLQSLKQQINFINNKN